MAIIAHFGHNSWHWTPILITLYSKAILWNVVQYFKIYVQFEAKENFIGCLVHMIFFHDQIV